METNQMEITNISIHEPYSRKGDKRSLSCTVRMKNSYSNLELELDPEIIQQIIPIVALAISESGKVAAKSLQGWAEEVAASASPVIEHEPQEPPAALLKAEDSLPAEAPTFEPDADSVTVVPEA